MLVHWTHANWETWSGKSLIRTSSTWFPRRIRAWTTSPPMVNPCWLALWHIIGSRCPSIITTSSWEAVVCTRASWVKDRVVSRSDYKCQRLLNWPNHNLRRKAMKWHSSNWSDHSRTRLISSRSSGRGPCRIRATTHRSSSLLSNWSKDLASIDLTISKSVWIRR